MCSERGESKGLHCAMCPSRARARIAAAAVGSRIQSTGLSSVYYSVC